MNYDWLAILEYLNDSLKYPHIPKKLISNINLRYEKGLLDQRIIKALLEKGESVVAGINNMFAQASDATNLSSEQLLKRIDFHENDLVGNRLDAAFAEIRVINFCTNKDLPRSNRRKQKIHHGQILRAHVTLHLML